MIKLAKLALGYLGTFVANVLALLVMLAVPVAFVLGVAYIAMAMSGDPQEEWAADHPCDNHQFYVEHRKTVCEGIYPNGGGPSPADQPVGDDDYLDTGFEIWDMGGR